jgi:adenine/guanine phosphoribosyltransferase-like PRPP-binding protein
MTSATWPGGYVRRTLGVRVHTDSLRSLIPVEAMVGLALRRNPRRAHLLVSRVLAKHLPTDPALSIAAGQVLGALVSERLSASSDGSAVVRDLVRQLASVLRAECPSPSSVERLRSAVRTLKTSHPDVVTIGYAETATALGQLVADTVGSYYIHSTRHCVAGAPSAAAAFEESHSHATSHRLVPTDGDWLKTGGTVILVDDELSTGTTVVSTIRALHSRVPQAAYLVATLVDLRSSSDRARLDAVAAELDATITVVSLASGTIELPPDILARAQELIASLPVPVDPAPTFGVVDFVSVGRGRVDPIRSARFGIPPDGAPGVSGIIAGELRRALSAGPGSAPGQEILVLGMEEFMSLPLWVADRLHRDTNAAGGGAPGAVAFSTTTRSPIAALDRADYAVASTLRFHSHDAAADGPGVRYAHNLTRGGRRFDCIVLMPEPGTDVGGLTGPGSVTEELRGVCDRVIVVLLPAFIPTASDWTPPTP